MRPASRAAFEFAVTYNLKPNKSKKFASLQPGLGVAIDGIEVPMNQRRVEYLFAHPRAAALR